MRLFLFEQAMNQKKCSCCKKTFSINYFNVNNGQKDKHDYYCKKCISEKKKIFRSKYPDKRKNEAKRYRKKYPQKEREDQLKYRYSLSIEEYNNILISQNGRCKICFDPPNKKPLFVDHNHKTNQIRGLLCPQCNYALGLLKEDEKRMLRMIEYIKK